MEDIEDVTALVAAVEQAVLGRVHVQRADLVSSWHAPPFIPEVDGLAVVYAGRLVATGQLHGYRATVHVHPDAIGRGLGTWLRAWTEARASESGSRLIGQTIPDANAAAAALLCAAGYAPAYASWVLQIEHAVRPPEPSLPAGVRIRHFRPGDEAAAYRVIEDAFGEWPGRDATSFAAWRALTIDREDFASERFLVAETADRMVGVAFLLEDGEVWVDKLAVVRDLRGRGIATALLETAFQRSFDLGYPSTGTGADSRTGAKSLYEKVGMTVRERHTHFARRL